MDLKCASFFSGVGGIEKGFELAGFKTIFANENNEYAATTYRANFPDVILDQRDIRDLNIRKDIPEFDIMLAGFPCQAFSIAGYREGFDDKKGRGNLFFNLLEIIKEKKPKIIFLENVKNLVSHDKGRTFSIISEALNDHGYYINYQVLNSAQYANIPQSRERIYIVCFKYKKNHRNFDFPMPIPLKTKLNDLIDFDSTLDNRYYYNSDWIHYKELLDKVKKSDTCYQWRRVYVRENKSKLCPTLTANMGTGGHNVPIIKTHDNRFRKLTPRECFNLQGFDESYILPKSLSHSELYKQAGNSVVIPVVQRIASNIRDSL